MKIWTDIVYPTLNAARALAGLVVALPQYLRFRLEWAAMNAKERGQVAGALELEKYLLRMKATGYGYEVARDWLEEYAGLVGRSTLDPDVQRDAYIEAVRYSDLFGEFITPRRERERRNV